MDFTYVAERIIGRGSFGTVYFARDVSTGAQVAIKRVRQTRRLQNSEVRILQRLQHPNIISMRHCFYGKDETNHDVIYVHLVMEYLPENSFQWCRRFTRQRSRIPLSLVKLFGFQLFRALAYLHNAAGLCHRDIKPTNILLEESTRVLKLCDFGSATAVADGKEKVSYVCSRYYRAPELLLGSTTYTNSVDLWGAGAVLAEWLLGQPLFAGVTTVDQLAEMVKLLGAPTRDDMHAMNPASADTLVFPPLDAEPWTSVFHFRVAEDGGGDVVDLVASLLTYNPKMRCSAVDAMSHACFRDVFSLHGEPRMRTNETPQLLLELTEEERTYLPSSFFRS